MVKIIITLMHIWWKKKENKDHCIKYVCWLPYTKRNTFAEIIGIYTFSANNKVYEYIIKSYSLIYYMYTYRKKMILWFTIMMMEVKLCTWIVHEMNMIRVYILLYAVKTITGTVVVVYAGGNAMCVSHYTCLYNIRMHV